MSMMERMRRHREAKAMKKEQERKKKNGKNFLRRGE